MTAIDVAGVRRVVERLAVFRERRAGRVFDQAVGRRQQRRLGGHRPGERQRKPAIPFVIRHLDREDHVIAGPLDGVDVREDALVRRRVPELFRVAGARIADPQRHRVAAAERRSHQARPRIRLIRRRVALIATSTSASAALTAAALATLSPASGLRISLRGSSWTRRHADAAATLLRLLSERQTGPADERNALPVG